MNKKQNIALSVSTAALLVLCGVAWYCVARLSSIAAETETALAEIAVEQKRQEEAAALERAIERSGGVVELADAFFVGEGEVVRFIEELEALARSWRLDAVVDTVEEGTDPEGRRTIAATISLSGTRASALDFLREVEVLPYRLVVEDARLMRGSDGVWSLTATIIGYIK
jgi:hypothetical protein